MKLLRTIGLFTALLLSGSGNAQHFAKFFSWGPGNPFMNTTFQVSIELKDSSGFLILADRSTGNNRDGFVIRTDAGVNELWTTRLNFQGAPAPYDNVGFMDIAELPNGNYCVLGITALNSRPYYLLFVLDTSGNVVNDVAVHDPQALPPSTSGTQLRIVDSTIVVVASEYYRFGYYCFDQNLNLLSHVFLGNNLSGYSADCIQLHDSSLLFAHGAAITKTDTAGNVLWAKEYSAINEFGCLYESPSGSIYAGGYSLNQNAPALAKFDAAGNPVFYNFYSLTTPINNAPIRGIYPCDDHLMLYNDTALIVVDTSGNVVGWGKSINAYNTKVLRPGLGDDFIITGAIFQDSIGWYEFTFMKFDDSTSSGCLHPRTIVRTPVTMTQSTAASVIYTAVPTLDTIPFSAASVNLNFDPLNGCPPNPLGTGAETSHGNSVVYPNPASESVQLQCDLLLCKVAVYDAMGRVVLNTVTQANGRLAIDVSTWPDGLYSAVIMEGNTGTTQRFVVKH